MQPRVRKLARISPSIIVGATLVAKQSSMDNPLRGQARSYSFNTTSRSQIGAYFSIHNCRSDLGREAELDG